jgi:hypothetical protein
MREIDVYHGSPHRFEEFDASKIGTGEGAQAYGHGIYLAESPNVARGYREALSGGDRGRFVEKQGKRLSEVGEAEGFENLTPQDLAARIAAQYGGDISKAVAETKSILQSTPKGYAKDLRSKALRELQRNKDQYEGASWVEPGALYTADLPDEMVDRMLDWDKPLSQQSQSVQKALQKIGRFDPDRTGMEVLRDLRKELDQGLIDPEITKRVVKTPELTAEETKILNDLSQKRRAYLGSLPEPELKILHRLENQLNKRNKEMMKAEKLAAINLAKNLNLGEEKMFMEGPALTSAVLRQAGIPGTSYLDAGSRGQGGSGTRNFVVFPGEEKKVRILERK